MPVRAARDGRSSAGRGPHRAALASIVQLCVLQGGANGAGKPDI